MEHTPRISSEHVLGNHVCGLLCAWSATQEGKLLCVACITRLILSANLRSKERPLHHQPHIGPRVDSPCPLRPMPPILSVPRLTRGTMVPTGASSYECAARPGVA